MDPNLSHRLEALKARLREAETQVSRLRAEYEQLILSQKLESSDHLGVY